MTEVRNEKFLARYNILKENVKAYSTSIDTVTKEICQKMNGMTDSIDIQNIEFFIHQHIDKNTWKIKSGQVEFDVATFPPELRKIIHLYFARKK